MIFRKIHKKLDDIIRRLGVLIGQMDALMPQKKQPFFTYLKDSEGNSNANGDYSNQEFYYEASREVEIHRLIFSISDEPEMQAREYGNLGRTLKNGWSLYLNAEDLTELPIQSNADIARLCFDVDVKSWGIGDELLTARWSFFRAGSPLYLKKGDRLRVVLNDDFRGLTGHYFNVQGHG